LHTFEISLFRHEHLLQLFQVIRFDDSLVFDAVVERTLVTFEAFRFFARLCLIHHWMKLLFFPAVTVSAFVEPLTAFLITSYKCATLPILAKLSVISEKIRLSSEILEVMRIDALGLIMIMIIRTPFSFEEKDVKVVVLVKWEQMVD
jgi:hypothetical protein